MSSIPPEGPQTPATTAPLDETPAPLLDETPAPRTGFLSRFDGAFGALVRHGFDWLWPALYGLVCGASLWRLTHPVAGAGLANNRLPAVARTSLTGWVFAAIGIALLVYVCAHGVGRWRLRCWPGAALTQQLNRWLSPLLALAPLSWLLQRGVEVQRPLLTVLLAPVIALPLGLAFYHARLPKWTGRLPVRAAQLGTWLALLSLWAAYGVFFSWLAITNHHGLHTATFDLGLYDNIFYQSVRGTFLGCSFLANNYHGAAHFDPILVLLSPLYLLYPRAESILILQSFWMGAGIFPLYLLARRRLGCRAQAVAFSSLWVLYPALQGANMYDFHSLSLVAPVLVLLWWFAEIESRWGYWLAVVLALLIREDVPLLLCFVAVVQIFKGTAFGLRQGWLTIVISLAYFVLVKALFMGAPEKVLTGTQTYSFAYYYSDLIPNGRGLTEMLQSLITNPSYALQLALSEDKVLFLLLLFVPLGLLPLLATPGRFALLYGLFFCLLATREPVFSIYFQYATVIYGVAFPLTLIGLGRVTQLGQARFQVGTVRLQRGIVATLWFTSLLLCLKFGGWVPNEAFRGGFAAPKRSLSTREHERYTWVEQTAGSIPKEASVGSTRRMGPHISNRARAYEYPSGHNLDYLLLDEGQLDPKRQRAHQDYLKQGNYTEQARFDKLVLYRKGSP